MSTPGSIFLDFNLPGPATWFYFSLLLAVALFFKFSRLLSIRNADVLTLFLLVPGLLLVVESQGTNRWGYIWLVAGSGYFLVRCLLDLTLEQRPALSPNLSPGGLAWLAVALFAGLVAGAMRPATPVRPLPDPDSPVLKQGSEGLERLSEAQGGGSESRVWVKRTLAVLCHLAVVVGLAVVGWRHFQDAHAGMAAATFYLLLPYSTLYVTQWHHVWPGALIVWAVVAYRRPMVAGLLLGLAAGSVYFPVFILLVWTSFYRRRGLGRFVSGVALGGLICLGSVALLAGLAGDQPRDLFSVMPADIRDWNPWRQLNPDVPGMWQGLHWAYRLPVFVAFMALVMVTALWPTPKNLAHVLALTAAVLIGTQFWYAREGGVYVLWYLPFLLLLTFRPNLKGVEPAPLIPHRDWLRTVGRWLARWLAWGLGLRSRDPVMTPDRGP